MNIIETMPCDEVMGSVRITSEELVPKTGKPEYSATIFFNKREVWNPEVRYFIGFDEEEYHKWDDDGMYSETSMVPRWGTENAMTYEKKAPPELWSEVNKALDRLLADGRVRGPLSWRGEPTWWRG